LVARAPAIRCPSARMSALCLYPRMSALLAAAGGRGDCGKLRVMGDG